MVTDEATRTQYENNQPLGFAPTVTACWPGLLEPAEARL
ncbi:uncharacterized protein NP_4118A [Natronomonas pharaonis DSM 2160]|uniref:Uncharacterized protein n=1 Tax=Natronomonas pharaonis (strain ATCC 35678 / DSM 2160 / CIP 103997 / JCM 8858 / NBRC 14720 / NCIMB 2260 / Gabara) TaxID=348780 RepID=A0A1U7EY61_NATPD|nr:uncharacterized protein NP_4118A [Natronomonas pharaonis DSM 2160]